MYTVNSKSLKRSLGTLIQALSLLLLMLFSQLSQAILLKIDPAQSEVLYTSFQVPICAVDLFDGVVCTSPALPQLFTITGNIEADVIHEHLEFEFDYPVVDRDLLHLITSNLNTGALDLDFSLSGALGLMSGEVFEVQDNPCFLFVGPGSCSGWTMGARTGSAGTWDGQTLIWSGYQTSFVDSSFNYTITATLAAVPEPGTLPLMFLMPALMFFSVGAKGLGKWLGKGLDKLMAWPRPREHVC